MSETWRSPIQVSAEKPSAPFGVRARRVLGGVALVLATLGSGEVYNSQSASAQSDSEYAPDCGYGLQPSWLFDSNGDLQPGPGAEEFLCLPLDGCWVERLFPDSIINELYIEGVIESNQWLVLMEGDIMICSEDSPPTLEDFRTLLDDNPWIERLLDDNSWIRDDIRDYLRRTGRDSPHWVTLSRISTPNPEPSTTSPITETNPETTPTDELGVADLDTPTASTQPTEQTPEPSNPEPSTTSPITETNPETTPTDELGVADLDTPTASTQPTEQTPEPPNPEPSTTSPITETNPETTPTDELGVADLDTPTASTQPTEQTPEPPNPEPSTTSPIIETNPATTPADELGVADLDTPTASTQPTEQTPEPPNPEPSTTSPITETNPETTPADELATQNNTPNSNDERTIGKTLILVLATTALGATGIVWRRVSVKRAQRPPDQPQST